MRQLVRLKEGKTAKIKDIPGFLAQCISSKVGFIYHSKCQKYYSEFTTLNSQHIRTLFLYFQVRQSPDTLIHVFIDEIPFSSFLDDNGLK